VWVRVPVLDTNRCITMYWGRPAMTNLPAYSTNGAVWSESYIGVWHLSETSGTHFDSTSNQNHSAGVNGNVNQDAAGFINGADAFDGVNDWIQIPDSPSLDGSLTGLTMEAWIFDAANDASPRGILSKRTASTVNESYYMFLFNPARYIFGNIGGDRDNGPTPVPASSWEHVSVTFDGAVSGNRKRFYRNGQLDGAVADVNTIIPDTATDLHIGILNAGYGSSWNGVLDEVRLSSEARSPDWLWTTWYSAASNDSLITFSTQELLRTDRAVVETLPATGITTNGATLNGSLISTGNAPTWVYVYYGTNDAGTNAMGWDNTNFFGTNMLNPPALYAFPATGLTSSVRYYYRYFVINLFSNWWGHAQSFTVAGPPLVEHLPETSGVGSALLNGRFLSEIRGDVTFYWGRTDGGINRFAWEQTNAIGEVATSNFSSAVTGLLYGQSYAYRAFATNTAGSNWVSSSDFFKPLRPAIGLTNRTASNISPTSAVLNADFNG
ncbi:MAG: LamG domain-containing protein, partial [Verrucomicrobiota bacterium]